MWIKTDGSVQKVVSVNEFDFKSVVHPGDQIKYISNVFGERAVIDGERVFVNRAKVVEVYKKFCMVDTGNRKECVNWFDILQINDGGYSTMRPYLEMLKGIE